MDSNNGTSNSPSNGLEGTAAKLLADFPELAALKESVRLVWKFTEAQHEMSHRDFCDQLKVLVAAGHFGHPETVVLTRLLLIVKVAVQIIGSLNQPPVKENSDEQH